MPRAGGPFPPGFQPLPASQGPHLVVPCPEKGLFLAFFHGHCVFCQMCNRPRCEALSLLCCAWLFLTQQWWGREASLSSVPGPPHSSGEGVNLPVGDSLRLTVGKRWGQQWGVVGHIDFSLTLQSLGQ